MKLFIDFDDTVFNTAYFKRDFFGLLDEVGPGKKFFYDFLNLQKGFDEEIFLNELRSQLELQNSFKKRKREFCKLKEFMMSDWSRFVFEDAYYFLEKFNRKDLFIVSYGRHIFQRFKIEKSGLFLRFFEVMVVDYSKGRAIMDLIENFNLDSNEKLFLIEDRVDQLSQSLRDFGKLKPIRIRRFDGRYSLEGSDFPEVKNLIQALDLIEKET